MIGGAHSRSADDLNASRASRQSGDRKKRCAIRVSTPSLRAGIIDDVDPADIERMRIELAAGLPRRKQWTLHGAAFIFDFALAQKELRPGTTVDFSGTVDPAWSTLYLFGESFWDGGASPWFGIHTATREIWGLDVELEDENMYFLSSTPRQFIETVAAIDRTLGLGELSPVELSAALEAIDPEGYPRSDWRAFATFLVEEGT